MSGDRPVDQFPPQPAADPLDRGSVRSVFKHNPHFTGHEVSELLIGKPSAVHLARLRDQRSLLGFRVARVGYIYPAFQFEVPRRRIDPRVAKINQLLLSRVTPDAAALWWWSTGPSETSPAALLQGRGSNPVLSLALEFVGGGGK